MAVASGSKANARPRRPEPPNADRVWVRRANKALASADLAHVTVQGDETVELRWVLVPVPADQPGLPQQGEWEAVWRRGLQTMRDFGVPRRPSPLRLGVDASPQALLAGLPEGIERMTHPPGHRQNYHQMNHHQGQTLRHHVERALELMRAEDEAVAARRAARPRRRIPRVVRAPGEPLLPAKFHRDRRPAMKEGTAVPPPEPRDHESPLNDPADDVQQEAAA